VKRDFDRIRHLLLECEASPSGHYMLPSDMGTFDKYQLDKMIEAGLITRKQSAFGIMVKSKYRTKEGSADVVATEEISLTWKGHDYLDAVRDNDIWEKTKATVAETGGNATIEIVKSLAVGFLRKTISDKTGIDV